MEKEDSHSHVFFEFLQTFSKVLYKKGMTEKSISHPNTPKHRKKKTQDIGFSHSPIMFDPMFCRRGPWVFSNAQQTSGAPQSWELEKKVSGYRGLEN